MPPGGVYEQISDKKLGVTEISSRIKKIRINKTLKILLSIEDYCDDEIKKNWK